MERDLTLKESLGLSNILVTHGERRIVGSEWNLLKWDREMNDIDCHRLYYRVDKNGGVAKLKLINGEIELLANKVYFVPAFSILKSELQGNMDKYFIHFRSNSLLFSLYRYMSDKFCVDANDATVWLFNTVIDNYKNNSYDSKMKVEGAINLLLADFFADGVKDTQSLVKFQPVFDYIDKNFRSNISLKDMADLINVSPVYFANSFKSEFGISPKQYLLNKRISQAQQLLLETNLSVKEIAYEVGFENPNYFSEYFAKRTGITALSFRHRAFLEGRN
jgi:AraC-like DNA-binding protein